MNRKEPHDINQRICDDSKVLRKCSCTVQQEKEIDEEEEIYGFVNVFLYKLGLSSENNCKPSKRADYPEIVHIYSTDWRGEQSRFNPCHRWPANKDCPLRAGTSDDHCTRAGGVDLRCCSLTPRPPRLDCQQPKLQSEFFPS